MYPLLKKAVPLPKLLEYQRYLFIGPHPDDIEVGCAPTVRRLVEEGKQALFLVLTDGCMGSIDPALSGAALIERRQAEARDSARLLGVQDVRFLPFRDGGLYAVEEAARAVAAEIVRTKPDVVFAPDPGVRSECHADHIKTGRAASMAMMMAPFSALMESVGCAGSHAPSALALYYTDAPNAYIRIGKQFSARAEAIACHKSQFAEADVQNLTLYFTLRSIRLGGLRGKCDGYRVLAPTHMHCFPEASRW